MNSSIIAALFSIIEDAKRTSRACKRRKYKKRRKTIFLRKRCYGRSLSFVWGGGRERSCEKRECDVKVCAVCPLICCWRKKIKGTKKNNQNFLNSFLSNRADLYEMGKFCFLTKQSELKILRIQLWSSLHC